MTVTMNRYETVIISVNILVAVDFVTSNTMPMINVSAPIIRQIMELALLKNRVELFMLSSGFFFFLSDFFFI